MKPASLICATLAWLLPLCAQQASIAWEARPGFRDFGGIAVAGGVVVSGNVNGKGGTFAFDAATGKRLWSVPGHLVGRPAEAGDAAHTVNSIGMDRFRLSKLNLKTGATLWTAEETKLGAHDSAPLPAGPHVFLLHASGAASAYDAASGRQVWTHRYSSSTGRCPTELAAQGGLVFFAGGELTFPGPSSLLWALDAATGQPRWNFAAKPVSYSRGECVSNPAAGEGVVVTTAQNPIFVLEAATGRELWRKTAELPLSAAFIHRGAVDAYHEKALLGWDLKSGDALLRVPGLLRAPVYRAPLQFRGSILFFIGDLDGQAAGSYLNAFDLESKRLLWKHRVNRDDKYPAVANWPTRFFLATGDAVYYENHAMLVKLK